MFVTMQRALGLLCTVVCATAGAQGANDYPSRPVTIVVLSTAGSAQDGAMRAIGARMAERLKQPVVIDNRVGASGIIGVDHVAKSAPDGYTLVAMNNTMVILPALRKDLPFDVNRDFAHVAKLANLRMALAVSNNLKTPNLNALFAEVKANPGKYTFASPGVGSPHHMGGELIKQNLSLDMRHIPHKDQTLALQSLGGGHVDIMVGGLSTLLVLGNTGKATVLGTTGDTRTNNAPGVPTFKEAGYGFVDSVSSWIVISAPARTPQAIVARLNRDFNAVLVLPEIKAALAKVDADPDIGTPEQTAALVQTGLDQWKRVVTQAGIKIE